MDQKQEVSQVTSDQTARQSRAGKKLTLTSALIILVILYLATGTVILFVISRLPQLVTWLEAAQWLLIVLWLLIGVYPPFMRWLKQVRARKE
jgi:hypothetical protein